MTHIIINCKVCEHLITEHSEAELQHCNLVLPLMKINIVEETKQHKKSKAVK